MSTQRIVSPGLNLNGTGGEELIQQYQDALNAIENAKQKLAVITPHGRDWQTRPDEDFKLARYQHEQRQNALDQIYNELVEIGQCIVGQHLERQSR